MRLYIAGLYASYYHIGGNLYNKASPNAQAWRREISHHLESYHYINSGRYIENLRRDKIKVFLDSGAFSSFSLGVDVDIDAYAEFIKEHQDIILMASVLDAIGDPEGTYHNQKHLEKRGAEVLPCFHFGEPLDLCEYYVKNYDYITLGGMVPVPNGKLEVWLDEVWSRVLTDKDGYARTRVHGFGLTSRYLMSRYPWYSVDSSTWVQSGATGRVILPQFQQPIAISDRSPELKKHGAHILTKRDIEQQRVAEALAYYGTTIEEVSTQYPVRWALNAFAFDQIGKAMGEDHWRKPFRAEQPVLF